jgi:quinol monooxygenase YgiN
MSASVMRVSIGSFNTDKGAAIEAKLMESKTALEAGIRAMRGNLAYYVGIDRSNNAMSNVSVWDSLEAAQQMATFQPMLELAKTFVELGVRFQRPILNFTTLWELSAIMRNHRRRNA